MTAPARRGEGSRGHLFARDRRWQRGVNLGRRRHQTNASFNDRRYVAFPPGSEFLLFPTAPARAGRAGLALYDTVRPRQRGMLVAGTLLTRVGLHGLLPTNRRTDIDWAWWQQIAERVVEPTVGPVGHLALRIPPEPFSPCALFLDQAGRPLAFVKARTVAPDQTEGSVIELLEAAQPSSFRTPTHLAVGNLGAVPYRVLEPLPEGPHRAPPYEPRRLWQIIDEYRAIFAQLPHPPKVPIAHVPAHGDLHVRNLRIGSDGRWWLFDWERFRWAPRLADELRYWSSVFGGRIAARHRDAGVRVLDLLRERGNDDDVEAALRWPDYQPKRPEQQAVYRAVAIALAGRGSRRSAPRCTVGTKRTRR